MSLFVYHRIYSIQANIILLFKDLKNKFIILTATEKQRDTQNEEETGRQTGTLRARKELKNTLR